MEIALKVAGNQFNPIQLNLIRFALGGLVILPFALVHLKKLHHKLHWEDWKTFFLHRSFMCGSFNDFVSISHCLWRTSDCRSFI
ncbi:EamA family transporter [Fructilactobacillus lindneri]|nr:EamA family transporter [Fructilactobacillus lindneri]